MVIMDRKNAIIIYSIFDNDLNCKNHITFDVHSKWTSINNIYKILKKESCKIKYFDEDRELISLTNEDDFNVFLNVVLKKKFSDNKVIVIAYNKEFDRKKFGSLKKVSSMKIRKESRDSFTKKDYNSFKNEYSSSSSSSFELTKSKKYKSIKRYAAEIKKELNYLTGSEVSDGQTIFKKWQIKNTGVKKWKANSVKCVLLPSDYSNWVTYEDVKVPVCFADQKVDIEMEIKIDGKWTVEQQSSTNYCQNIKLKWLLFMDKLVKDSNNHFMDFILVQLNLEINVKNRNLNSVSHETHSYNLKKETSESSIEKIDQDFSIVDISEEEVKKVSFENEIKSSRNKIVITHDIQSEVDIDLPDCPNGDDFQITDFIQPNTIITIERHEDRKTSVCDNKIIDEKDLLEVKTDVHYNHDDDKKCDEDNENSMIEFTEVYGPIDQKVVLEIKTDEPCEHQNDKKNDDDNENSMIEFTEVCGPNSQKDEEVTLETADEPKSNTPLDLENSDIDEQNDKERNIIILGNGENIKSLDDGNLTNSEAILNSNISIKSVEIPKDLNVAHVDVQSINCTKIEVTDANEIPKTDNEVPNVEHISIINDLTNANTDQSQTVNASDIISVVCEENPVIEKDKKSLETDLHHQINAFPRPALDEVKRTVNTNSSLVSDSHQQPYRAGIHPGDFTYNPIGCVPNAPPYPLPQQPFPLPNMFCHKPIQQNFGNYIAGAPSVIPMWQVPIQNQSSNPIIQELVKQGNIHNNVNDAYWQKAPNGQHYELSINLERLSSMGFKDREKNIRLLNKFGNNMEDVIHELVD